MLGVLSFGIGVAIGAPTYNPTDSENVRPTFNGINVTGAIENKGGILNLADVDGIDIGGPIRNGTAGPVVINDAEGVQIAAGDLTVQAGNVSVTGRVTATGGFGSIKQYTSTATIAPGPNKSALLTSSCNVGQMLLSCGISISADGYVNTIYPLSFSCSANIYNQGLVNTMVKVYARCLDYAN
jgi:hypothetical protein